MREETCCCHMGYSFRLAVRVLLYVSSHRQDNTYHGLCYTSRGALAGKKEIFYLTMHSTHFNYGYMVQDHSDNERRNLLPLLHGLLFPITNKVLLYTCTITAHTTGLFYTSGGAVVATRNTSMEPP